ncbi:hypothetical protein AV656_09950 [Bhargavaea cecembensis]|uniref:DUF1269 domain-containing protein n=1 Tax=Bhargavaea cecembensis TaxID=394098 RepID=A0A161RIA7_9BACL|nr:hypothetical protein [Bhargavaea cecembensis]KZE37838.1 hypothetical protein AV656_09950 [Bhargavaea cecembensis]
MENVMIGYFSEEQAALDALADLESLQKAGGETQIAQVGIFKKDQGMISLRRSFGSGAEADESIIGGIIGGITGVIAGPVGTLLSVGVGGSVGSEENAPHMMPDANLFWSMTLRMKDEHIAIVAVVQELDQSPLDQLFGGYTAVTERFGAAEVQEEIEHARNLQDRLEKTVRDELTAERSAQRDKRVQDLKVTVKSDFANMMAEQ